MVNILERTSQVFNLTSDQSFPKPRALISVTVGQCSCGQTSPLSFTLFTSPSHRLNIPQRLSLCFVRVPQNNFVKMHVVAKCSYKRTRLKNAYSAFLWEFKCKSMHRFNLKLVIINQLGRITTLACHPQPGRYATWKTNIYYSDLWHPSQIHSLTPSYPSFVYMLTFIDCM